MGEFEQWLKSLNENGRVTYFLGQEGKVAKEAWDFQQSKIEQLEKEKQNALSIVEQAEDGYYGFTHEGGSTDELASDLKKALRGES